MSQTVLSFDAIVNGLVAQHVPREKAVARALELTGRSPTPAAVATTPRPVVTLPISFRLPWSMLVSDDDKYGVLNQMMILRQSYREAKKAIAALVGDQLAGAEPLASPVALVALVYVPDNRIHDVPNFAKCVHDALEGVVYVKDRWLYESRWRRDGVDVDAPRADITISPFV